MKHNRTYLLLFVLLFAVTFLLATRQPGWVDSVRNYAFDEFQRLDAPPYDPDSPVRIVGIDEASLKALGQWPWPRTRLAELVDKLRALGAAAIAFDVLFAEPDRTSLENLVDTLPDAGLATELRDRIKGQDTNDDRFAKAVAAAPVALGVAATQSGDPAPFAPKSGFVVAGDPPDDFLPVFSHLVLPLPGLRAAATGLGVTNWLPDRDQVVRRVPLLVRSGEAIVPSLAMESLRLAQGASSYVLRGSNASGTSAFGRQTGLNAVKVGDIEVATGDDGSIRPRYTHATGQRYISAADLLAGHVAPDAVAGRVILIGTPVVGLGDVRATPLDAAVPGVEVQAEVLEQLLSGQLLSRPDWAVGLETVTTFLFLALLAITLPRLPPALAAVLTLCAMAAMLAGAYLAFDRLSLLIDPAVPCLMVGVAYLAGASLLWEEGLQAERRVRRAFGKYVTPAVVARIAQNPNLLVLSGETRELTMLFCDVRSFSTISENLSAREVSRFLNDYLTPMTDVILRHEGTIDKYIGDAIVAFWNAPLDVADHPRRAVEAALAMRVALRDYNQARAGIQTADNPVNDIRIGIGLNVGECSVGNMGSLQRFDYSALGDPMNVAARLEALTKTYDVDLLATDGVVARTPDFAWLAVESVRVKGRQAATQLYALFGDVAHAGSAAFRAQAAIHGEMLAAAEARAFRDAAKKARELAFQAATEWAALYENLAARYTGAIVDLPDAVELPETNLSPPSG